MRRIEIRRLLRACVVWRTGRPDGVTERGSRGFPGGRGQHVGMNYMYCAELVERTTDYLDDALGSEDQVRMDRHLHVCPGCQAHFSEIQVTVGLLADLSPEQLSAELESDLVTMFRGWAAGVRT